MEQLGVEGDQESSTNIVQTVDRLEAARGSPIVIVLIMSWNCPPDSRRPVGRSSDVWLLHRSPSQEQQKLTEVKTTLGSLSTQQTDLIVWLPYDICDINRSKKEDNIYVGGNEDNNTPNYRELISRVR